MGRDKIEEAKSWRKQKLAEGWEDTPMGLLPKHEIQEAGMAWDRESQEWRIPTEWYISDGTDGHKKGTKRWGTSQKFIKWKKNYNLRRYGVTNEEQQILNEIAKDEPAEEASPLDDISFK